MSLNKFQKVAYVTFFLDKNIQNKKGKCISVYGNWK